MIWRCRNHVRLTHCRHILSRSVRCQSSITSLPDLHVFRAACQNIDRPAVHDNELSVTYGDILSAAARITSILRRSVTNCERARIAFLLPPSASYVAVLCGVWAAGGVCVPLCESHPVPERSYVVKDSDPSAIVVHRSFADKIRAVIDPDKLPVIIVGDEIWATESNYTHLPNCSDLRPVDPKDPAMIIYTSGTTGRPKGVVASHGALSAQIRSPASAWGFVPADRLLHTLPLHHVHGIVNCLLCPLSVCAQVTFLRRFDPKLVWRALMDSTRTRPPTIYSAVPPMYSGLIRAYDQMSNEMQQKAREASW
eukprot:973532_1